MVEDELVFGNSFLEDLCLLYDGLFLYIIYLNDIVVLLVLDDVLFYLFLIFGFVVFFGSYKFYKFCELVIWWLFKRNMEKGESSVEGFVWEGFL